MNILIREVNNMFLSEFLNEFDFTYETDKEEE